MGLTPRIALWSMVVVLTGEALGGYVVYDGSLAGGSQSINDQGKMSFVAVSGGTATGGSGVTTLNTSASNTSRAGHFSHIGFLPFIPVAPVSATWPTLDAASGYTVRVRMAVDAESHASSDRAGFSILTVASTNTKAIEIGFWNDRVWAYALDPVTKTFFRSSEEKPTPTGVMTRYDLSIKGSTYKLIADGRRVLLSGALRDYTPWVASGVPFDPYEVPSFLFVGDDTSSAGSTSRTGLIEILPLAVPGPCNRADITDGSGQGDPDGQLTGSDVVAFFQAFFGACIAPAPGLACSIADITDGSGTGDPDGQLTGSDVVAFFQAFFQGC